MKITIYLAFYLFAFSHFAEAQQLQGKVLAPTSGRRSIKDMLIVDSGHIRLFYALNAQDINNSETYIDLQRLDIGEHSSKYYSHFVFNNDSLIWSWLQSHPNANSVKRQMGPLGRMNYWWSEYKYSEYFKDYQTNLLTEYARMPHTIRPDMKYSENIPTQDWTINNDTLTVCGYLCQKATCRFRGRDYIAWFTMDIPINNGPWKFGGLPGLILKVYDVDQFYTFECIKIENSKFQIKKYDFSSYQPTERLKLLKFQRALNEDFCRVAKARSKDGGKLPDPVPYEPLELE